MKGIINYKQNTTPTPTSCTAVINNIIKKSYDHNYAVNSSMKTRVGASSFYNNTNNYSTIGKLYNKMIIGNGFGLFTIYNFNNLFPTLKTFTFNNSISRFYITISSNSIKIANKKDFEEKIIKGSQGNPIILDLFAKWCGPCKILGPKIERLVAAQKPGSVTLAVCDVDEAVDVAEELRVEAVPTVYGYYNGKVISSFRGSLPDKQLQDWIAELVSYKK